MTAATGRVLSVAASDALRLLSAHFETSESPI